jgi:AI-2E family transporter
MVGPVLASIPAILISLLLPDPFPRTYLIIGYFIIIQLIESYVLGPRIVGRAVGLHPVASILALIIGAQLFGAFGALLATPILAALWVVSASLYRTFRGESADEILARKRSSWIRPRSRDSHLRLRLGSFVNADPAKHKTGTDSSEVASSPPAGVKQQQENGISTPGKIERIDLLRAVPQQEQTTSASSERSAESGDEK